MSWRTNRLGIGLRNVGRRVGINRLLAKIILGSDYEKRYDQGLSAHIQSGICIWDVGANVGHYTKQFSQRVGDSGKVCAFEPSPMNYSKLVNSCGGLANVECLQIGLGRSNFEAVMQQGEDDLGATSRVLTSGEKTGTKVKIRTGLSIRDEMNLTPPSVLKIDVEGFEYEVLEGFGEMLSDRELHAVGVEIHFQLLKERGEADAPARIEQMLRVHGFKVQWTDPSHILATR